MRIFYNIIGLVAALSLAACSFISTENKQHTDVLFINTQPSETALSSSKLAHAKHGINTNFSSNRLWKIPNTSWYVNQYGVVDSSFIQTQKCTPSSNAVALYSKGKLIINSTPLACLYQWGMTEEKVRLLYNYDAKNGFVKSDFTAEEWTFLQSFFNAAQAGLLENQNPKIQRKALKNQVVSLVMGPPKQTTHPTKLVDAISKIEKLNNQFKVTTISNNTEFQYFTPTLAVNLSPKEWPMVLGDFCPPALQNLKVNQKTIYAFKSGAFLNCSYIALNETFATGIHVYNLNKTEQVFVFSGGPKTTWNSNRAVEILQKIGATSIEFLGEHTFEYASVDVPKSYYAQFNDATFEPIPGLFITSEVVAPFGDPNSTKAQNFILESAVKKAMNYSDTAFINTYCKF